MSGCRVRAGEGVGHEFAEGGRARSEEASSHRESVVGHPWEGLSQRMM